MVVLYSFDRDEQEGGGDLKIAFLPLTRAGGISIIIVLALGPF